MTHPPTREDFTSADVIDGAVTLAAEPVNPLVFVAGLLQERTEVAGRRVPVDVLGLDDGCPLSVIYWTAGEAS